VPTLIGYDRLHRIRERFEHQQSARYHQYMLVSHRTQAATAILRDGFQDPTGRHVTGVECGGGIWVADRPVAMKEGTAGDTLLGLVIPDAVFAGYERVENGTPYRKALIPASELNKHRNTLRILQ
jgi:hypothetical protein